MKEIHPVEQPGPGQNPNRTPPLRPARQVPVALERIASAAGASLPAGGSSTWVTGASLDSRSILPGDLYLALPGAHVHGAAFARQAVAAGAVAVLTDDAGARLVGDGCGVPVLVCADPRAVTGAVAALVYGTDPAGGGTGMAMFGITGTNGKTTTTYFLNSLLRALGKATGLIGTIEILAGDQPIPSKLTTPESTDVHALLAVMSERGLDAASMEVSSHALAFGRVDSVVFDVAGFTNLTQDHLDLHGGMDGYFAAKAQLFTPEHARRAVVTVDGPWGRKLAETATVPAATLSTLPGGTADWRVAGIERIGVGSRFELHGPGGVVLRVKTGLPGGFNVSNAALALAMVAEHLLTEKDDGGTRDSGGTRRAAVVRVLQAALDASDPFTLDVPGRMQLVGTAPVAVVDFAHNPDALRLALAAIRSGEPGSRVIVVFGATGERDVTKRPIMGAIAAENADVVIITDDDPHDEEPAGIRAGVLAGAVEANTRLGLGRTIEEHGERAAAIRRAVELARPGDTILVAGRGHEVHQEVKGVNVALDDRVELKQALARYGFPVAGAGRIES
ncbi:Mur ligase family protein [Arthrobacter silviterrae]|uniref:UDP-N-acetylmuramyl-tripeptide synthetase n=1 Tax=Arthrobacter silviterrae TaxID=2026658 RepID=A0ABX0D8Z4_9MICC|nr:UDP-N-acetylmuramoyl-L-alanyl-D-glutamate--2,6-diaminopimelate ligase [Arthrobacter silviterrae]